MSRNSLIAVVVAVIVLIGGFVIIKSQKAPSSDLPTSTVTEPTPMTEQSSPSAAASAGVSQNQVKITTDGFLPKDITISVGETVTWMNSDTDNHNVSSDPHPVHTLYTPLNLGMIKAGDSKSLSFPTTGTYKYHDHLNPSLTGSVTVK